MRRDHQPARDIVRRLRAAHLAQHMQAAVEAGGGAGRGQHVAVVDIEHIGIEPHARKAAREVVRPCPVGRRRPVVEHAGGSQHERAEAQPDQLGAACMGGAQCVEQGGGWHLVRIAPARHDDRVRIGECFESMRDGDREAGGGGQDAALGSADAKVEIGQAAVAAVLAEHHARYRKMERVDAVERDDRDDVAGRVVARRSGGGEGSHQPQSPYEIQRWSNDGPILANIVIRVAIGKTAVSEQCSHRRCLCSAHPGPRSASLI